MDFELKITPRGDYLLVELSGQNSYDAVEYGLRRVKKACDQHRCYKILMLSSMASMEVVEAYQVPALFRETGFDSKYHWAWVPLNKDNVNVATFVETVLKNRGLLNGAVFEDEASARDWLLHESDT